MTFSPGWPNAGGMRASWPATFRFACFLLIAALVSSCSGKNTDRSVQWDLHTEGESAYQYLVLNSAALRGDVVTVRQAFEKLLALDPDASVYREAAEFYLNSRQWVEARNTARQGLERYPDDLVLTLVLTESYMQERRPNDAIDTLSAFVKAHPDNNEAVQELARLYLLTQRLQEAVTLTGRIPAKQQTSATRHLHARGLIGLNRLGEAEQELRRVVRDDPDFLDAWVDLAVILQTSGRYREAAIQYEKALEQDPDNLPLWLRLIDTYLKAKKPELALKTVKRAPASPVLQMEAAAAFLDEKLYTGAATILNALKDRPGAPEEMYFYLAALALESRKDSNEAIRLLGQVSFQSRLAERALRWRLQLMLEQNQGAEALTLAQKAIAQLPDDRTYRVLGAQVAAETGNFAEAKKILQSALEKWPDDPALLYHLASMADAAGDKAEAMRLMEKLVALDPDNPQALNYVGYTLAEQGRDLPKAYELIQKALAGAPNDLHILDSLAWVQYQMGDYQSAWKSITYTIERGADNPTIWEHYGDIARKIGKKAEARKAYARALKLNPENPDELRSKIKDLP